MSTRFHNSLTFIITTLLLSLTASPAFSFVARESQSVPKLSLGTIQKNSDKQAESLLQQGLQKLQAGEIKAGIADLQKLLTIGRQKQNPTIEGTALVFLARVYTSIGEYEKAIDSVQQALTISRQIKDGQMEGYALAFASRTYLEINQDSKARELAQQALAIGNQRKDASIKGYALVFLSLANIELNKAQKALELAQQAVTIANQSQNPELVGFALLSLSAAQNHLGASQTAIAAGQKALEIGYQYNNAEVAGYALVFLSSFYIQQQQSFIAKDLAQKAVQIGKQYQKVDITGSALILLSRINIDFSDYQEASKVAEEALLIGSRFKNIEMEGYARILLTRAYISMGEYQKAKEVGEPAVYLGQQLQNLDIQSSSLLLLASAYELLGESSKAVNANQQLLAIVRQVKNSAAEAQILFSLADMSHSVAFSKTEYQQSLDFAQQALVAARRIKNQVLEAKTLDEIASIYSDLNEYDKAIEFAEASLALARSIKDKGAEFQALITLSLTYITLGDYPKFKQFAEAAFSIAQQNIQNPFVQSVGLMFVNMAYFIEEDYQKMIGYAQQGLKLAESITVPIYNKQLNQVNYLFLAMAYGGLKDYQQAINYAEKSLAIAKETNNRSSQATVLIYLGNIYRRAGKPQEAINAYRQALALTEETQVAGNTALVSLGLARVHRDLNQPIPAITYYKESINNIEKIRRNIKGLSQELQESFLVAVQDNERSKATDAYRELADLLLSQGRAEEAQQVLELLKIQEISEFSRGVDKKVEVPLTPAETEIKKAEASLIAFGKRLYECEQQKCLQLKELRDQRDNLNREFLQKISQINLSAVNSKDINLIYPGNFLDAAESILKYQPDTVLIYPFVLEDKIWILWATGGVVVKSYEVRNVGQRQLQETVTKFRGLLENPDSNIAELQATGKQLYDWLIKPLETELKNNKIKNLVFSLDRSARYIPMSALFDGEKYLVENYNVSTVLSAGLTNMTERLPARENTPVLALGLSDAVPGYNSLANVPTELDAIVKKNPSDTTGIYPGLELLNKAFDFAALRDNLQGKKILHIATHGAFVPNDPEASYLLSGTGKKLPIVELQLLQSLSDIHLVVLSACETSRGGTNQDGLEISGIGSFFLGNSKAKAVMASLWLVNDASTSLLMQQFYQELATGKLTKAQALRQAQLNLLQGKVTATDAAKLRGIEVLPRQEQTNRVNRNIPDFAHPYYWAPFILIGNGL